MPHSDILIIGGGLVGAAAACALRLQGRTVHVVEARPEAAADVRWYALSLASQALLEHLGVWALLPPEQQQPYTRMQVWEESARLNFSAAEAGVPCLGYLVAHAGLLAALHQRLAQLAVGVHPARLQQLHLWPESARAVLSDGSRHTAQLVVGADGAEAHTRMQAGIAVWRRDYGQQAIFATLTHHLPHDQTARQRFLPTGPLALLPLPGERHSALVWTLPQGQAQALLAADEAEFLAQLQEASAGCVGLFTATSPRRGFPLRVQQAVRMTALRLALLGDAAHVVHPLAGQGVNLGLLDVAALAESLQGQRDSGSVLALRHYERLRRTDNSLMLAMMDGLNSLFGQESWGELRRRGLHWVEQQTWLKRPLARAAVGLRPPKTTLTTLNWKF